MRTESKIVQKTVNIFLEEGENTKDENHKKKDNQNLNGTLQTDPFNRTGLSIV